MTLTFVNALHSWLRWAIVAAGVVTLFHASRGRGATASRAALFFTVALDLQVLAGVALLFLTPWISALVATPGEAMREGVPRYWALTHWMAMLIATGSAHAARIAARRAPGPSVAARRLALWTAVSLLVLALAMPWPALTYGRPLFRF